MVEFRSETQPVLIFGSEPQGDVVLAEGLARIPGGLDRFDDSHRSVHAEIAFSRSRIMATTTLDVESGACTAV